ncbi:MAG: cytochrome c biogenesis protein ResB [Phaeodactylibacter sp.]|nr:cytochrome c biogenesis protein ResB [Phaeodactylibacter sp.]MCB9275184.1 cytochrome c biogenesis protein ResB [Lewinellaceae bacterium]
MADHNRTNSDTHNHRPSGQGFGPAAILMAVMALAALMAQNLSALSPAKWVGPAVAAALALAYAGAFFKPLKRSLDTPYFATLNLLAIAFGTALGTFVTQNTPDEVFTQQYGAVGSSILRVLQLHDVFHSWWYVGLFAMLAASLAKMSFRRAFTKDNLGFHLAHLGPILVLAGFWVDHFYGFRGIIRLETGQQSNLAMVYDGSTSNIIDSTELPFNIRLDTFEFEKYAPDYRIQAWRNTPGPLAQPTADNPAQLAGNPEIVASFPLVEGKIRRIYGTDVRFRLVDFYPNFTFDYSYPEAADTIAARDPGVLMTLKTPFGDADLQLLSNRPGRNIIADVEHLGAWLEFYWEAPEALRQALSGQPDPEWAGTNRVILVGAEQKIYNLTSGELSQKPLEAGAFYTFPGKEDIGFAVRYLFPDAAYLQSMPATDGDELLNPVAKVEVWNKKEPGSQEAYLYPGNGSKAGTFMIPGLPYFLALESFKDKETKYWKSTLSALGPDGVVLKNKEVKVNEPMLVSGYRFYQSGYDPNNPNYSGIGVSHEPGLPVIYFGFAMLVLGCALLFYGRYRKPVPHAA